MEDISRKASWSFLLRDLTWAMRRQFQRLMLSTVLHRVVEGEAGFELIDLHYHGKKEFSVLAPMKFLVVQIPFPIGERRLKYQSTQAQLSLIMS
jgi:hypothetical protein